ncbi:MAG: rod shape-determining protein RodA [Patescibacteria group bacterium]|nr:rod shape-determining protein RodA [Patescibacteria group bacterium]
MNRYILHFKKFDWLIVTLTLLLVSLGLLSIYSTSGISNESGLSVFWKQCLFVLIGLILMLGVSSVDYRSFRSYANIFYVIGFLLLGVVLIFGTQIRGTTGWIYIFGFSFQPVELVKLFLIIMLARYFSRPGENVHRPKHIMISGLIALVYIIMVFLQPDFGSALIYFLIWVTLIFLLNIKRSYIITILLIILIIGSIGWLGLKDYQKERLATFVNPNRDTLKTGYNITQSIISIGSGKIWGRGLGSGSQSQLKFLPEQQNDFIFAVIAEELGFVGASLVIIFFGVLFYRLLKIARSSPDDFSLFSVSGIIIMIYLQMLVNISMNMGLVPVVGIPLPFVSAGGSSLITNFIALGFIQSIIVHRPVMIRRSI